MNLPHPLFDSYRYRTHINGNVQKLISETNIEGAIKSLSLAHKWLMENDYSENNYKSYRTEITTFLNWMLINKKGYFSSIKRTDLIDYLNWCQNPEFELIGEHPKAQFISKPELKLRIPNPEWRPFNKTKDGLYSIKKTTLKSKFSILSIFFNFLIDLEESESNPAAMLLRSGRFKNTRQETVDGESQVDSKHLTPKQWEYVKETAFLLIEQNPDYYERTLFLAALLYSCYLRIGEVSGTQSFNPSMGQFHYDKEGSSWYFKVENGKGGKTRFISVSEDLLNYLKRYRKHLGLSPLPDPYEQTPLFPRLRNGAKGERGIFRNANLGVRQLRALLKNLYSETANRLLLMGLERDALDIKSKSAHTLRHTGISHDINYNMRPLSHVKADAGHSNLETTSKYEHTTRNERHGSARYKKV